MHAPSYSAHGLPLSVCPSTNLCPFCPPSHFHSDPHPGNLLKVTEGPHAGKLALLDFGLVAEIPTADREAMVSATIHLANRGT